MFIVFEQKLHRSVPMMVSRMFMSIDTKLSRLLALIPLIQLHGTVLHDQRSALGSLTVAPQRGTGVRVTN